MDLHSIRQSLRTKSIYDIPLRVTFYARVSSESDEQLNSLGNQVSYYEEFIRKNSAWEYVEGYVDEGLSAATTKKREDFHRMVEDGKAGLFDLIITKEITRFARNTLDSILYTRELLSAGVGVFFQNDNINTFDEDSELRLTIMSGIAQDELRKLSSRVKFGHAQAIKKSVVLGNSRIFGYVKDGGRLVIDEGEAPMVRELFELYATGDYSMKQIETRFWDKGYRNHNGKRIAHTTMSGVISNPKYKGYYVGNKVKVVDLFTKKQKFLPPEEWVMFKDETGEIVPAIVSEELWDQANAVLKKRSEDVKGRQGICNHANLLTGKLYCTHCGAAYYRRESADRQGNKNSKWVCSGKIKNGADSCASFPIYEEELKPLLFEVFQETEADADALIEEYVEMYKALGDGEDTAKQIAALRQQIELAQKKKSKLLGYNAAGQLSDRDFLAMNKDCDREMDEAERQIYDLEQQQLSKAEFKKHIDTIRRVLREAKRDAARGIINKEFVDRYIDKIFVTPEDGRLKLQIKIFTGDTTDKYLTNLRRRTGHTFKYLARNADVDFILGHADYFQSGRGFRSTDEEVPETVISDVNARGGIEESGRVYGGVSAIKQFVTEDWLRQSYGAYNRSEIVDQVIESTARRPDGLLETGVQMYGMEDFPLSLVDVLEGDLAPLSDPTQKAIAAVFGADDYNETQWDSNWAKLGDTVTIRYVTEMEYFYRDTGEIIEDVDAAIESGRPWGERAVAYEDKDYTVCTLVRIPNSISYRYRTIGSDEFILGAERFKQDTGTDSVMSYLFNTTDEAEEDMEAFLGSYTESVQPLYDYESRASYVAEFEGFRSMFLTMGGALSLIIGLVGVLNFVNAVLTGILTRKRELAVLQSVGMTGKQLKTMLVYEGLYYTVLALLASLALTVCLGPLLGGALGDVFWFFTYRLTVTPILVILPAFLALGALVPLWTCRSVARRTIVERLREAER